MKEAIILIPPSEGKVEGGNLPPLDEINETTLSLIEQIQSQSKHLEKFYGLKEKALKKAIQTNKEILEAKTCSALERYSGVVYKAIDVATIKNKKDLGLIYIFSPLFGIIGSNTPIPNYKFKIDKLKAIRLWEPINTKFLENKFVIDLMPKTYEKAIHYDDGIKVEFILLKNGKKMPAGHQGKHIKGRFIRWMIETKSFDPKGFNTFSEEGYKWKGTHFEKIIS